MISSFSQKGHLNAGKGHMNTGKGHITAGKGYMTAGKVYSPSFQALHQLGHPTAP
jgi:hypothetical protein